MMRLFISVVFLLKVTLSFQSDEDHPVCIIGGGITGLTLANRYHELGIPHIVFEKEDKPGGKAVTWRDPSNYYQAEMGPLLFSKNSTNSLALFRNLGFELDTVPHATFTAFALGTNVTVRKPPQDILAAQRRYFKIRSQFKLDTGYVDTDASLHVSLGTWLIQHRLKSLIEPSQIMVTASGYGSVFETPAIYGLRILDEHGDLNKPLYTVKAGLDKVFTAYAKSINIRYKTTVKRIYSNPTTGRSPSIRFKSSSDRGIQPCSKVITAFPPLHSHLKGMLANSHHPALEILKQVKISKYASFAIINDHLSDYAYFPFLKLSPPGYSELTGEGRLSGLLRQKNIYTGYAWIKGSSPHPARTDEVNSMLRQMRIDIDQLVNTPHRTRIPYYHNWDYFPHVTTDSLNKKFYNDLDKVQGKGQLYIASPLLSFETIHNSIEAAHYMLDKYLLPTTSDRRRPLRRHH